MGSSVLLPQRAERGDGRQKAECESQKANALWAVNAATDRDEEFYDPAHKEDILGRTKTRTCTPFVKPFAKEAKERNGKLCTITTESRTRRRETKSRV